MRVGALHHREQSARRFARAVIVACVALALVATTTGVAEAQNERVREQRVERVRPVPTVETLRLACAPDFVDGEQGVLCQWSEATNPQTRGHQLFRITDGSARELVTTVGVDGRRAYFDTDVSAPSSLIYGVISVNTNGRLLGRSAAVKVQFGVETEQLRLACSPDSIEGERGVLCRWSEAANPQVRGYLVYRITNNTPRELVARITADGRLGYFDTDVAPGSTYSYGVVAVDSGGALLGQGGPQQVIWPALG